MDVIKPLYIVGYIDENDNMTGYFTSGRNCNIGAYDTVSGARKAVGYCKRYDHKAKILEVTNYKEVE